MCQLLLYYGADPFQTDNHGRTAYDVAVGETKCFFARAFRGLGMESTNRIPRIGFLRALTQLFACASVSAENDSHLKRMRHSWSCLHTHNLDNELARAKLISGANIGAIDKEESLEDSDGQKERNGRRSGVSDEIKSEPGSTSDDTFFTARTGSGDEQKDKCVTYISASRYRPHLTSVWVSNDSSADDLSEDEPVPDEVLEAVRNLPDPALRREFESRGVVIGPLTPSTRCVYEMKLARVLAHLTTLHSTAEKKFSSTLERVIAGMSCEEGKKMDAFVVNDFFCSQGWRQGVKATSFCYILIDPSLIMHHSSCTFVQFLKAIFYVGKGVRSRPLQHLVDAVKAKKCDGCASPVQMTDKLRRIWDVWAKGYGVVSLHVFQNLIPVEAFTREAAMIDALGLENLTNVKRGDYYGVCKEWSFKERTLYGSYLLLKALDVFRVEGCRQLFENDVHEGIAIFTPITTVNCITTLPKHTAVSVVGTVAQ
uniref:Ankyrin repeat and LEM domain-containing protein 1 n=1 Tax=Ascaris suum TaxID=6253 RepID=F1KUM2_ASCSU